MAPPRLSIITCCKGRLAYLKRALPTFVGQTQSEVIVVDYGCPDGTKDWLAIHFPDVHVGSVTNTPLFNLSHARNVGARLANARWLVFADADQLLTASFATELLATLIPGTYLRTLRQTPRGPMKQGVPLACETDSFWAVGGYDDAFAGWGAEDLDFIDRLDRAGIRELTGAASLVETLRHSNTERSTHYEHDIDVSMVINHHYAKIKQRYFETRGRWFTDQQRHGTYRLVKLAVLDSLTNTDGNRTFDIRIADSVPPWTARLNASGVRSYHNLQRSALSRTIL